jgi:hypothetical protein
VNRDTSTLKPFAAGLLLLAPLCVYGLLRTPFTTAEQLLLARTQGGMGELAGSLYSPLYLLLLKLWSGVSVHPSWLRLLSALCGLAALPLAQRVVRGLGGSHSTLGALLLLGGAPLMLLQASRLSPGTAGLVAILGCFACFLELGKDGDWRWLVGWLVGALVACGIHAGLFWMVIVQWAVVLLYREQYRVRQLPWWLIQLLPAAWLGWRYHPLLGEYLGTRLTQGLNGLQIADSAALGARLSTGLALPFGLVGTLLLAALLCVGLWVARDWRRDPRHGLLLLCLVVPGLGWLLLWRDDAHLMMPLVCWCTLAAMGLRQFPRWGRQILWSIVALVYLWSYWRLLG